MGVCCAASVTALSERLISGCVFGPATGASCRPVILRRHRGGPFPWDPHRFTVSFLDEPDEPAGRSRRRTTGGCGRSADHDGPPDHSCGRGAARADPARARRARLPRRPQGARDRGLRRQRRGARARVERAEQGAVRAAPGLRQPRRGRGRPEQGERLPRPVRVDRGPRPRPRRAGRGLATPSATCSRRSSSAATGWRGSPTTCPTPSATSRVARAPRAWRARCRCSWPAT